MRRRVAVEPHHLELVAGERKLNVVGGAGIQEVEQHALSLFDAHRLAITQTLPIDGEALVADFPSVRFLVFLWLPWLRARIFLLVLRRREVSLPLMRGQKEFLIVLPRLRSDMGMT
jgi:hypothetical protein